MSQVVIPNGARTAAKRLPPMRVAFLVSNLPVGGAEVLLLNLVQRIDRARFSPIVVCTKSGGELAAPMKATVPVYERFLANKWDIRIAYRLTSFFRRQRIDAVVTVGAGDKMFWGRLCARLAGVPVVCSALHSTGWPDGVGRLNRWLTPLTDAFIACAGQHARFLIDAEKFPPQKVHVVPNGVDTERFRPHPACRDRLREQLALSPTAPCVGIVAALRPEKNHEQFIDAARRVLRVHPDCHFLIVGDGPCRPFIENKIAELGLEKRVHMLGARSDIPQLLAGLDVFCLTSRNEANPVSVLEALACAVPVVSPAVGSVDESVIDGRTGLLTPPLSAEHTAEAIIRLLDRPQWAHTLGQQGRELVEERFSIDAMIGGYQALLTVLYDDACRCRVRRWQSRLFGRRSQVGQEVQSQALRERDTPPWGAIRTAATGHDEHSAGEPTKPPAIGAPGRTATAVIEAPAGEDQVHPCTNFEH
ncbi:MAG: glycosyl transferase family 1 [Pirellulaceae bacterium]|nr:MAG: glycosyl transferase family 1 [Pirellulaceae bacterium]